ncbi:protein-L-isoaspartate(D-aspartate) O-methyltransferase [Neorhizobium sp. R1-B]|nr:protein-L-isoaspartate(D-aspartate) O-methyltransferase [Neorhizobium sp. R1-B]
MQDFEYARERMIEAQIARRGLRNPELLRAFREVPREAFVESGFEEFAYEDTPLAIGEGQTISQPYIVALMIERAKIGRGDVVLEVGTGSGYAAAVLSPASPIKFTPSSDIRALENRPDAGSAAWGSATSQPGWMTGPKAGRKPRRSTQFLWQPAGHLCRRHSRSSSK